MDFLADSHQGQRPAKRRAASTCAKAMRRRSQFTHETDVEPPDPIRCLWTFRSGASPWSRHRLSRARLASTTKTASWCSTTRHAMLEPDAFCAASSCRGPRRPCRPACTSSTIPTDFYTSTTPLEPNSIWVPVVVVKVEVAQPNGVVDHLLIQTVVLYGSRGVAHGLSSSRTGTAGSESSVGGRSHCDSALPQGIGQGRDSWSPDHRSQHRWRSVHHATAARGATTATWTALSNRATADNGDPGDTDAQLRLPRSILETEDGLYITATRDGVVNTFAWPWNNDTGNTARGRTLANALR